MLWKVIVFSSRSAYFFFVTSTMMMLLQAVFTDLGATLAETNLSIAKRESLVMGFSSIDLRTIKLGKEINTSSISLSLYVSVLGWDLLGNLFGIHWGFFFDEPCLLISFSLVLCSIMKSNFCWELTEGGTFSFWLRRGYTTCILKSRGELQTPANPRPPVLHTRCPMIQQRSKSHPLNLIDPQPPPSSTYDKKGLDVCLPQVQLEYSQD